ncbi:hypothetical protein [Spirillospora sp. NPDC048819]|uniref:hypothetical protein n=1 Tax=Spirillospora sp. NPDC048819 TaxID=3155268 RepID=UPI0033D5D93F
MTTITVPRRPLSPSPRNHPPRSLTASGPGRRVDARGLVVGPWSDRVRRLNARRRSF